MANQIRNWVRRTRHVVKAIQGRDVLYRPEVNCVKRSFGNDGAAWSVCTTNLSPDSIVYSFGIGEEISFDLELIHHSGMLIHAFDPTPRSIEWVKSQSIPEQFLVHSYGLAGYDGTATFTPPEDPNHISHTIIHRVASTQPSIEVPVFRLRTIMQMLGHEKIDLLKMDIEGAEYEVIKDLISSPIQIDQLLIEFHHRWPEVGVSQTKEAVEQLKSAGFKIFDVSASGEEYSFIKQ